MSTDHQELPEIRAWDVEGVPMFDDDELDERYSVLIDRMRASDAENGVRTWFDFDMAVGSLIYSDADLDLSEEAVQIMRALVDRARLRREAVERALGLST